MEEKDVKGMFNSAMLNILVYLESLDDIANIDFQIRGPPITVELISWERRNNMKLPNDMKAFYSLFNGFSVKWKVSIGANAVEIGNLSLNKIDAVSRFPIESHHSICCGAGVSATYTWPELTSCAAFILDSNPVFGQIMLLYRPKTDAKKGSGETLCTKTIIGRDSIASPTKDPSAPSNNDLIPEVWLLDSRFRWHFIASTFSQYLRLMCIHLGIIGWPLNFTPESVPIVTYQWMNVFCRERLVLDMYWANKLKSNQLVSRFFE